MGRCNSIQKGNILSYSSFSHKVGNVADCLVCEICEDTIVLDSQREALAYLSVNASSRNDLRNLSSRSNNVDSCVGRRCNSH